MRFCETVGLLGPLSLHVTLRVLLAESGTEETLFLRDVLTDLDGARYWSDWVHVEASHASTWADTAAILATEAMDILLLDPDLPDSQGAETFRRVHVAAPNVPVILLVESSATSLAERLVRDGAQDFLLKQEVDCAPLARAIRNALERHRLLAASRATSMTDQLTGLLTRPAFLTLANRDCLLADRLRQRMMILVAEPDGLDDGARPHDAHRRDLALVEAADSLRRLAGPAALVARLGRSRFGLLVFDTEAEPVEEIRARFHNDYAIAFGAAVFDPRHPVSLDALLEQAILNLRPIARHAAAVI
ncbi:MAG: diguanylate cyclase [Bryobacterales bacterium]|nr:diguanylate cyclase [Bryobacterales bacterium]